MISKNTTEYIKKLSQQDTKNISQKALKVSEETGELAKVVLPFDNAQGTTHRFISKEQILEEVVDVYLASISIAYDLDFSDDDIEQMVVKKLTKWAERQERSLKVEDKTIPYEIHITVKDVVKEDFIAACKQLDVKPIILDLQSTDGKVKFEDVMTSSVYFGNNRGAYEEMKRISNGLSDAGFDVAREKIETVPWHPAAPRLNIFHIDEEMPPNCYFETHINVKSSDKRQMELEGICKAHGAHLSRNVFKRYGNDTYTIMITLRSYSESFQAFEERSRRLQESLRVSRFKMEKVITEFSIYDTKISHDAEWLNYDPDSEE